MNRPTSLILADKVKKFNATFIEQIVYDGTLRMVQNVNITSAVALVADAWATAFSAAVCLDT